MKQSHGSVTLNEQARKVVSQTVLDHCAFRGWELFALNVRSNHVHTVVDCGAVTPEVALGQLKAWATRRLREAGLYGLREHVWTEHGSTRYLWDREAVEGAVSYVTDGQGAELD